MDFDSLPDITLHGLSLSDFQSLIEVAQSSPTVGPLIYRLSPTFMPEVIITYVMYIQLVRWIHIENPVIALGHSVVLSI